MFNFYWELELTKITVKKRKKAYAHNVEQDGQPENGNIAKPLMPRMDRVPFNAELHYSKRHGGNKVAHTSKTQPPTAGTNTGRPIKPQEKIVGVRRTNVGTHLGTYLGR